MSSAATLLSVVASASTLTDHLVVDTSLRIPTAKWAQTDDALSLARGQKPMPDAEKRRSAELTEAILLKRGREALSRDDAAGHARPLPAWLQEQVEAEAIGGHAKAS